MFKNETKDVKRASLGWRITRDGEYKIDLPPLSSDEEAVVLEAEARFRRIASEREISQAEAEKEIAGIILEIAKDEGLLLDSSQKQYLSEYARMHSCGFAFLDSLLADDSIEEISVIGPGLPVYVFVRKEGWKRVNAMFETERAIMDVANKMAKAIGRRITFQHPRLDAMLPDGSRLHASLSPISSGEITIRKFRRTPFSPRELVEGGVVDWSVLAFLSMVMQGDNSLIIAGNTASGKTTTLNALFCFVPRNERILITEETPEISVPHEQQVRLVANKEMGIGLSDLVYDSLRMRPDRIIVGEVRNAEEVGALFDVLLGGQARGAYATFHAQSAAEAVLRLRRLGVPAEDVPAIDAIVVQRRVLIYDRAGRKATEVRRMTEIAEPHADGIHILFSSSRKTLDLKKSALVEKIAEGFGMNMQEFASELRKREMWLKSAPQDFAEFFSAAQQHFFGL